MKSLLAELEKGKEVLNKIQQMRQGMIGDALINIVQEVMLLTNERIVTYLYEEHYRVLGAISMTFSCGFPPQNITMIKSRACKF